jgi:hypothetical protein
MPRSQLAEGARKNAFFGEKMAVTAMPVCKLHLKFKIRNAFSI